MAKANWKKKIDQHVAGGGTVGLSSWKAGLLGKASKEDVIAYASQKGYTLGQAWQNAAPVTSLKQAGPVLSEKELLSIAQAKNKSPEKILLNAVGQGLSIGSKVVNQFQKGTYTDPMMAMARQVIPGFAEAAGKYDPILQQLASAGKLDKGSSLFIGSKGSTATVLPRGFAQPRAAVQSTPMADVAAPSYSPEPVDMGGFDLGDLGGGSDIATPDMPALEDFAQLSSSFETKDPLQLAALGQSYIGESIRAKQRQRKTRRDYMRAGRTPTFGSSNLAGLTIGGLTL